MDEVLQIVDDKGDAVDWILDTHPHADHLMASANLKQRLGAPNAVGEKVREIAELWSGLYHLPDAFDVDASFDHLFAEGDAFTIGNLPVTVMPSPGHTLGSITYVVGGGSQRADYIELRETRDATLSLPDRMLHALQVNLRAGALPDAEADGHRYLKIPLNRF
jgi:glyoxylase-like metal-dependent hydrolase (beta-lactamase superfamily II)